MAFFKLRSTIFETTLQTDITLVTDTRMAAGAEW